MLTKAIADVRSDSNIELVLLLDYVNPPMIHKVSSHGFLPSTELRK